MQTLTMTPGSSATFTLTAMTATGAPVLGATATAVFRRPNEHVVDATITLNEAGEGKYVTAIDPAWTTEFGAPRTGRYYLDVTVTTTDSITTERFAVLARF